MLMGIGTGTALGAAAIEQTKTDPKQQRLQALLAKVKDNTATDAEKQESAVLAQVLASHGFFDDILSDVDGICLHRFQTVVWTVVMGGIFVSEVMSSGEMPEFDGNTLALLGISSGTYLGFKIPETPA
jgi:hypothetical protein